MADTLLDQIEEMIDQLTPLEQAKLLEYLTPRITRAITARQSDQLSPHSLQKAWRAFFKIGDELAVSDTAEGKTLTAMLLSMRR
jgi:Lhr-like helicase